MSWGDLIIIHRNKLQIKKNKLQLFVASYKCHFITDREVPIPNERQLT